jgi:nitrogenase iron protein NifH
VLQVGRHGVVCCEAGGPAPGVGCGGRGVARTLEFLETTGAIATGGYDVVVFDVLGDVVCGGFAAPLRQSFAEKVLIVISEEPMALYAANNIAKAICTYQENGVRLGGLIANLKSAEGDRAMLARFAERLSTRILGVGPRDPLIQTAERQRQTIVDFAPESPSAVVLGELASRLLSLEAAGLGLPTPLEDEAFFAFLRES